MKHCWASFLLLLLLVGCATQPQSHPERLGLRLAPETLGISIARQQHLKVEREGRVDELNVALEIDSSHLEMVGLAFGQRVLSLHYDGKELHSWRHVMLPAQVHAEDVLEDVQLTLWPEQAIASALPSGWTIEDAGLQRTLYLDGKPVTVIHYQALPHWSSPTVVLENLRYRYRLTIQSVPAGP
ncbi:hypothetical protein GCM10011430_14660 [Oxalicibacterium solurbis]|uniref:DUF3261 domain-containing protein n=2 Tax=Oxalicibacterium solurbis TaxID=69280 RepID=A0A8J3AWL6_9BURK|nr:hypothetical protein GCM10011430_14660 [Oxalicibacterium solurbis]